MGALRIGTRKSELALWQTRWVQKHLQEAYPNLDIQIVPMETKGDRILNVALTSVADKGFFTAEIEHDLFAREIDIAVHSLKDLPTQLPEGLAVGAYCARENPHDVFIGKDGRLFADLPAGSKVGTSSLRRVAQLSRLRPDIEYVNVRGNLNTRYRKLQENDELAGIMLAAAGVLRLGWADRITEYIPFDSVLPAPGQGVIAVEYLQERTDVLEIIEAVNDKKSSMEARCERAFQSSLEGGCQTPLGAHAVYDAGHIQLSAGVFSLDGSRAVFASQEGNDPEAVGRAAATQVLNDGAGAILEEIRALEG